MLPITFSVYKVITVFFCNFDLTKLKDCIVYQQKFKNPFSNYYVLFLNKQNVFEENKWNDMQNWPNLYTCMFKKIVIQKTFEYWSWKEVLQSKENIVIALFNNTAAVKWHFMLT